jgi:hypothetical protein
MDTGWFCGSDPFFNVPGLYVGPVAKILGGAEIAMLAGLHVATFIHLWLAAHSTYTRVGSEPG